MNVDWFNVIWEAFPYIFIGGIMVWLYAVVNKWYRNTIRIKRLKRGKDAEEDARKLLENQGYDIHDYQPRLRYHFMVDGERLQVSITPDFLVKKGSTLYVVEVKTGEVASNPNSASTRRQLLEYSLASKMPLLFVDMEVKKISEVKFPFGTGKSRVNWWKYLSLLILSTLAVALLFFAVLALLKLL